MYNFGGEMKVAATDVCSNLMKLIDNCIGIASQACAFAETSSRELRDAFISAREYIQSTFESITKISDSYCFTTQTVAEGGLYRYQYDAYYSNKGDEPVFHGNILVDKVSGGINWGFKPVTASKINYFDQNDHSKLKTRLRMMRNSGMDLPETYLEYLAYAGGIPEDAIATYEALHAFRWVSDDALRIITGLTTRNLNASKDTFNLSFEEDWKGKYQSRWEKEGWSGKIAETNYLSASNGEVMSNHRVCAYARYYEDMIFFMDDEFWSFVDNLSGNYMFMLSHN